MKFHIKRSREDVAQPWYFTLVGDNGETIATSETHEHHGDVVDVINVVRAQARESAIVDRDHLDGGG